MTKEQKKSEEKDQMGEGYDNTKQKCHGWSDGDWWRQMEIIDIINQKNKKKRGK